MGRAGGTEKYVLRSKGPRYEQRITVINFRHFRALSAFYPELAGPDIVERVEG